MIKPQNTKAQMRKGILEYCILSVIDRKEKAYASDIIEDMKQAEMIVVEGTLYPLLSRLNRSDFLTYHWQESTGGPPRKYYTLTEKGKEFLDELDESWRNINQAVRKITGREAE